MQGRKQLNPIDGPICWPPLEYACSDDYASEARQPRTKPQCPARRQCDHKPGELPDYYVDARGVCYDRAVWQWWRRIDRTLGWELYRELFEQRGGAMTTRDLR